MANPAQSYVIRDESRAVKSLALQDRIDLTDSVTVTAGARFDDYDDIGSRITPRFSVVWRASDQHIVKAQYAEGFRTPTFFEMFGGGVRNRTLDFEVNATTELNYVYRRPRMVARATFFRSDLTDMVFGGLPGGRFGNTRAASAEGIVGNRQVRVSGEGYDNVDLTVTRQDLFVRGLTVRAGVKNAADDEIRYIGVRPTGAIDALVYGERVWWVGVSFRPE